jgi:hypothetical protein
MSSSPPSRTAVGELLTILRKALSTGSNPNSRHLATLRDDGDVTFSGAHQCPEFAQSPDICRQLGDNDSSSAFGAQIRTGCSHGIEKAASIGGSPIGWEVLWASSSPW